MKFKALALGAAAVAALACGSARANVVTYELTADASYTLGGVAHTGFIDIMGTGDTAGVTQQMIPHNPVPYVLEQTGSPFTISITLTGVGVFNVTGTSYAFDLENGTLAGFGSAAGGDFIYFRSALLDAYNMVSTLPAVSGTFSSVAGRSVATSGGQLAIASFNNGQFSARVTPSPAVAASVPEPATWVVLLAGFSGLGAALRTRRRTVAA